MPVSVTSINYMKKLVLSWKCFLMCQSEAQARSNKTWARISGDECHNTAAPPWRPGHR